MKPLLLVALLVLPDRGLFPEFDSLVSLALPAELKAERLWLQTNARHGIVTLYEGREPIKAYPAAIASSGPEHVTLAALPLAPWDNPAATPPTSPGPGPGSGPGPGIRLRPADLTELSPRVGPGTPVRLGAPGREEDQDGDGIVDRIDIALGARKLVHNRAAYLERYVGLPYPGGDVPRGEGVCSDTVIRALRNAGIDL